ncbi:MAG: serine--tRNA ligase [Simkaniaceae bacterium]|nr:serine--tRNA ligase [Simkaniaceae bacterium]MCF7852797.1 serine--tRNA ligase [Simkaniaceae bacterium]
MLDFKKLRDCLDIADRKLKQKEGDADLKKALSLYDAFCSVKIKLENKQSMMNQASKQIGEAKRRGESCDTILRQVSALKEEIALLNDELKSAESQYMDVAARLPNMPMDEVKESLDPADNVEIMRHGEKPHFSFEPKNHVELNESLNLFDFKRGAKLSGSGWPVYSGLGARLEWALIQFMIDFHIQNGFHMIMPPHLVRQDAMYGAGQLPKFGHQLFRVRDEDYDLYLIPTAEVALNGLHQNEIIEGDLPKRYVAYTPCFRREAGGLGAQERGLIRVHQFNKVEMFCYAKPEESEKVHGEMILAAESLLQQLGLHYRNMLLVTGDTSFSSAKTVDIEVWLPGQNRYYEVSSISNCTDFQARRSQIRYRNADKKAEYVHTLNGSGLATSRVMVALLENFQQEDGSVLIPEVLQKYLNGLKVLTPESSR